MSRVCYLLAMLLALCAIILYIADLASAQTPFDNSLPGNGLVYVEMTYNTPASLTATFGGTNRPIWSDSTE